MKIRLTPILIILLSACSSGAQKESGTTENVVTENTTQTGWKDSLVSLYLKSPKNKLLDTKDTVPLSWMYDKQERNGKKYITVQIGHNNTDRFVTSNWLYIDSTTKQIYDYDLPNDSLILWKDK